jgi:hypothetical protein
MIVALAVAAATLAAIAAAGLDTAKQRIAIQVKGGTTSSFVLTTLTSGAVKHDTGTATFCCWSRRSITRDGQSIEINNPQMTLTSKRGTLVARNVAEWIDVPDGWGIFTGTWKIVRGTGDYAGLTGGGRGAGVMLQNGITKAQFEGFLSSK